MMTPPQYITTHQILIRRNYEPSKCESLPSLEWDSSDDSSSDNSYSGYDATANYTVEDDFVLFLYERIEIYNSDVNCLEEGNFINDKIVDFILSVLRDSNSQNQTPNNYYEKTSRRFKNDVLLNKKTWVIPVCENYRWYVINAINPETARPRALVMDSRKRNSYRSVKIVEEFLRQKFCAEQEGNIEEICVEIVDISPTNEFL
ncbi:hypothetical protein MFLAVUS_009718 [Mucor flavus]|uniref:Ubiquitin-like protease family profile domain-containing protein n=1 Tax=Mucor flavus TaxID=439312 RepID=A0ABP9ZAS1_9FUNG